MKWFIVQDVADDTVYGIVRERTKRLALKKARSAVKLYLLGRGESLQYTKSVKNLLARAEKAEAEVERLRPIARRCAEILRDSIAGQGFTGRTVALLHEAEEIEKILEGGGRESRDQPGDTAGSSLQELPVEPDSADGNALRLTETKELLWLGEGVMTTGKAAALVGVFGKFTTAELSRAIRTYSWGVRNGRIPRDLAFEEAAKLAAFDRVMEAGL